MSQAVNKSPGIYIPHTPASAVAAGDVVVVGDILGIATRAISASEIGSLLASCVCTLVKKTGAMSEGDKVFWDEDGDPNTGTAGSGAATTVPGNGSVYAGVCLEDAASGDDTVLVRLQHVPADDQGVATAIADPGDAGAIPVTKSGTVPLVSAGAETRTLADPTFPGQTLNLGFKTDGGDCVVTSNSPVNQTGNNTLTFADVGDHLALIAIEVGSDIEWRVLANDGVALSTV